MREELLIMQPLPIEDLELTKMYFTSKNHLVQIKKIDLQKRELHVLNLTEQCKEYRKLDTHNLVKKVR